MSSSSATASRRAPIPILMYHQTVQTPPPGTPYRWLCVPPALFSRQLRTLRLMGYRGLSMRDLEPYLAGEKTGKVVGITLDDGYVNNLEHALPALRDVGFTATTYMVSAQFGGSNVWDHASGIAPSALMSVDQLKAWVAAGMDVGAHTRNHVDLLACDEATSREEIAGSKRDLEQALGVEVRHFCYPYGKHSLEHAEMARQAGYVTATTVDTGRARPEHDAMRLPRVTVYSETRLPMLLAQVATGLEDWRQRRHPARPGEWTARPAYGAGGGGATAS